MYWALHGFFQRAEDDRVRQTPDGRDERGDRIERQTCGLHRVGCMPLPGQAERSAAAAVMLTRKSGRSKQSHVCSRRVLAAVPAG